MGQLTQINNTLTSSSTNTEALNAYQGYVLNEIKLAGKIGTENVISDINNILQNDEIYLSYGDNLPSNFNTALLNALYPIGSIYQSTTSTNPGTLFGGTWSQTGLAGRMLVGANSTYTAGSTGGASTVTLTANQSGTPAYTTTTDGSHTHTAMTLKLYKNAVVAGSNRSHFDKNGTHSSSTRTSSSDGYHGHWVSAVNATTAHENMPPYLVVYMWTRTG